MTPALLRPLKSLILPFYNRSYHRAQRIGDYLGALSRRNFDRCRVCGRFGPMLYRRRVIPAKLEAVWGLTPRLAEALARKESSECSSCHAKLRARRLAEVLLGLFPAEEPAARVLSVRDWARTAMARALRIAELNRIDGLHEALENLPGLAYSEYQEGVEPGSEETGIRCEDLSRLTYPDASFDLVLTSETLEHVPDLDLALSEIRRVLRPGGWHLFTVPLLPGVLRTYPRARIRLDGTVEELAPPIRHPGGDVGYPVFTEFGADFPDLLEAAGFEVTVWFGPVREDDLGQVFATRRRPG